ncbi:MAG: hypothetical protein ACOX61_02195 [Brooklawnia sp.]|jgi:uncharacterized membrane protein
MATQVYKTLAKIVGAVLLVLGLAALFGGNFAHGFVSEQLEDQVITMPTEQAIDGQVESGRISAEDGEVLRPFAGETMSTGPHAEAFANHYIRAHMTAAANAAGVPEDQASYSGIGAMVTEKTNALKEELAALPENADKSEQEIAALANAEIANPATTFETAAEAAELQALRMDTFLDGNTLRGMLLNAFGWWLVGTIAIAAGWALLVLGVLLVVLGFVLKPRTAQAQSEL